MAVYLPLHKDDIIILSVFGMILVALGLGYSIGRNRRYNKRNTKIPLDKP